MFYDRDEKEKGEDDISSSQPLTTLDTPQTSLQTPALSLQQT